MLLRVIEALSDSRLAKPFLLSIESEAPLENALASAAAQVQPIPPSHSAPASVLAALRDYPHYPFLITTGDHPLLTPAMIEHVLAAAEVSGADVLAALATGETIRATYPQTRRTYFKLGGTEISGCNIFIIMTPKGLKLVDIWSEIEKHRKIPWKLIATFGIRPLLEFLLGRLTPHRAFDLLSERLSIKVMPIFMPFAEAAIDVDKPTDLELAEAILLKRG
jgi:CTP:molybdopterin cytidylyltransferase MocA